MYDYSQILSAINLVQEFLHSFPKDDHSGIQDENDEYVIETSMPAWEQGCQSLISYLQKHIVTQEE